MTTNRKRWAIVLFGLVALGNMLTGMSYFTSGNIPMAVLAWILVLVAIAMLGWVITRPSKD